MSVNKVILIGNLGADPEVRDVGETSVCKMRLATTEVWYNKEKEKQERTEWHNIVVWGKQGEDCAQYLAKGRQIYVEGSLKYSTTEAADGTTKYFTDVVAQKVQFLGARPE